MNLSNFWPKRDVAIVELNLLLLPSVWVVRRQEEQPKQYAVQP